MTALGFERRFSLAALDALFLIRERRALGDTRANDDLVAALLALSVDFSALDFVAAIELDGEVDPRHSAGSPITFLRECIIELVVTHRPEWSRAVALGRAPFLRQLSRDERQCFRAAELVETPPDEEVVLWWDRLASRLRREGDLRAMERARHAELLSLHFETQRLERLGLERRPEWVAIEDNRVGYDILSADRAGDQVNPRYVEVKSSVSSPLRFIVTANEWRQAERHPEQYHFHIWDLSRTPPFLHQRTVAQVRSAIPQNQAQGSWTAAEIRLGGG